MTHSTSDESATAKLFEEVKLMVRDLPDQIETRMRVPGRYDPVAKRRYTAAMFRDVLTYPEADKTPAFMAALWLLFMTGFRDDFPGIHKIGVSLVDVLQRADLQSVSPTREKLEAAAVDLLKRPAAHGIYALKDEIYVALNEISPLLDELIAALKNTRT